MPFIDYQDELRKLGPVAQRNAMGASNWRLVESGRAKWEDVVTKGRVRDFREVADRLNLSVDRMVKAGVRPDLARRAYDATHTEAHAAAAKDRDALIKGLKAHGVKDERIAAEVGQLLAGRVGVIGPGGSASGISPPPKPPPPVPPAKPKPTPKPPPAPAASKVAAMGPAKGPEPPGPPATAPHEPPHVAGWRRIVAESIPEAEAEAARAAALHARHRAELDAAVAARKKASAEFAGQAELRAAEDRLEAAREATRRARDAAESATSRAARLKSWEEDRKLIPNLVPPVRMDDRLALYADGDRKVKAIAAIGDEVAAAVEAGREARAKLYDAWTEADRYVRSREFLKLPKKELAKFEEAKARVAEMEAELRRTADTSASRAALARSKLSGVLKVDDPAKIRLSLDPSLDPSSRSAAADAEKFLSGIVARGDHPAIPIEVKAIAPHEAQRDYYDNNGTIHSSHGTNSVVTVHEAGHALDDLSTLGGRKAGMSTREFLAHRVGDEVPRAMRDVAPGNRYEFDEYGRKDRFDEVFGEESSAYYTGKVYASGHSSEVMSMGLQELYRDPAGFAKKDPEYCKFVIGMLDGSLR